MTIEEVFVSYLLHSVGTVQVIRDNIEGAIALHCTGPLGRKSQAHHW